MQQRIRKKSQITRLVSPLRQLHCKVALRPAMSGHSTNFIPVGNRNLPFGFSMVENEDPESFF